MVTSGDQWSLTMIDVYLWLFKGSTVPFGVIEHGWQILNQTEVYSWENHRTKCGSFAKLQSTKMMV